MKALLKGRVPNFCACTARKLLEGRIGIRSFSAVTQQKGEERKIFDKDVKRMHLEYYCDAAKTYDGEYDYLRDEIAKQLMDRLGDIKKDFPVALDLGCRNGSIAKELINISSRENVLTSGIEKLIMLDETEKIIRSASDTVELMHNQEMLPSLEIDSIVGNPENMNELIEDESIDVVMSGLSLHWTNDLVNTLRSVNKVLKPDGVFLAAMVGGDTLFELRTALVAAEQEREGGLSPHVSPMIRSSDICSLLSECGFTLTTVDTLNIEIEFENAFKCMEHLSRMGESNAVLNRRYMMKKETFLAAAAAYQALFENEDGCVPATVQVVFMIGWKPHKSQPEPKKIGSAKHNLGVLGDSYDFTKK